MVGPMVLLERAEGRAEAVVMVHHQQGAAAPQDKAMLVVQMVPQILVPMEIQLVVAEALVVLVILRLLEEVTMEAQAAQAWFQQ